MQDFNWFKYIPPKHLGGFPKSFDSETLDIVYLDKLIEKVVDQYWEEARQKSIHLGTDKKLPKVLISGNINSLSQIVDTLVRNALNQTLEGYIKLDIVENEDYIGVTVIDSGLGIQPDENIFYTHKDFRGRPCRVMHITDPQSKLSTIKELVEEQHGYLELCVQSGVGTARRLWLPKVTKRHKRQRAKSGSLVGLN